MSEPTLIFAGGGTGGHLFPAIAIAEQALMLRPGVRCQFLCSTRPLDAEILTAQRLAGEPAHFAPIPAQPFGLRPRTLLRFVSSWGGAVRASRASIRAARTHGPVVLAAMGGFVAAPAAQAARAEGVPRLLVNLDAVPGRANRWIARSATRVLTAAPVPGRPWTTIPPIVRAAALAPRAQAECRRALGLSPDRPTLLITGASQGAGSMNRFLQRFVQDRPEALRGWQVIHQTGKSDVDETRAAYGAAGVPCLVQPFFETMGLCWGAADCAVSRAGAGSVAEVWACRVPTLFLPYPYHRDQHQRENARPLAERQAALLAQDHIDPDLNLRALGPALQELLTEPARRTLREALASLGPADGARRAAESLLDLAAAGEREIPARIGR